MKYIQKILSLLLALTLVTGLVPPIGFSAVAQDSADGYYWIEDDQTPIASVERTGDLSPTHINDGVLNNVTNTWEPNRPSDSIDYYGYTFDGTYNIKSVVFYSGEKYSDGGFFDGAPVIKVLQNEEWVAITSTVTPEYDAVGFKAYTFDFDPVDCDGVMLYGKAGGTAHFISCAEIKVLGYTDTPVDKTVVRYEFERYIPVMELTGEISAQNMLYASKGENSWSRNYHLFWRRGADDNTLAFDFDVKKHAIYDVNLKITKANDFGKFDYYIDDVQIGGKIDSYNADLKSEELKKISRIELTNGTHKFKIVAKSTEEGKLFGGFDYFELERFDFIQSDSKPIASIVRPGDFNPVNINDGNLSTSCNLYDPGKNEQTIDYIGYEFPETRKITELRYHEGPHFVDGGWFREPPAIKVLIDGEWVEIETTVTPEYDAQAGKKYIFSFEPVECDGILVHGKPGGSVFFISCAEIEVLAVPKTQNDRPNPETTYSYADIASRLYNMETLALTPEGETSSQFTSYDRASRYDSVTGEYTNWSANGDWTGYLYRQNDGGYVIGEMDGPGFINRIWMAYAWTGKLAIYIDGSETPVLDVKCSDIFTENVFPYDELSYKSVSVGGKMGGFDCYVPITYNESCKVVLYNSGSDTFGNFSYYIIGYTNLSETTAVESFTYPLSDDNIAALQTANDVLSGRATPPAEGEINTKEVTIKPDSSETVFETSGEGAVTFMEFNAGVESESFKDSPDLSEVYVSVYWDGNEKPSVYTTLGDLFGSHYGVTVYDSYIMGVKEDGTMYCRWYMPYSDGAKIVLTNNSDIDKIITAKITTDDLSAPAKDYSRFNAEWNRLDDRDSKDERYPDSNFLLAEGTGRYVGVSMHIYQLANQIWWGEGDEKFFVDGEKFPSWYGTGSEDYFGYAWCQGTLFNQAYHGQSLCEGAQAESSQLQDFGNKINYRFHITDNVPFYSSFDANMEKYFDDRYVKMAATTFYYLTPEATESNEVNIFTAEDRAFNYSEGQKASLFYEGEEMTRFITNVTNGSLGIQDMGYATTETREWSGHAHLWWRCTEANASAKINVMLPISGTYNLNFKFTTAGDYGKVQVYLDDKKVGEPIDCYSSDLELKLAELGEVELTKGDHKLTLEVVGKNDSSSGYFIGLDYIEFDPILTLGDANGDGQVTVTDVVMTRAFIMNDKEPTEAQKQACDINKDGNLTVTDIVGIRRIIMDD